LYTPDSGTFELAGKAYKPTAVHEVAKAGIARTFQNIRLFADMTALENVMVGRHIRTKSGLIGAVLRTPGFKQEEAAIAKRSQELLDYVGIGKYADFKARTLSYGDQRRLEIARALATDPQLIALDEPAAGMNATEKVQLRELIDRIRKDNRTILLIEHDVKLVMGLCDRVTVLDYGKQIAEGAPADVQKDEKVIRPIWAQVIEGKQEHGSKHTPEGDRPEGRLRRHPGGQGRGLRSQRRRTGHADRLQRRRQDHHHEGHHRHLLPMLDGDIEYLGKSIKGRGAWDLVKEGLAMVPEGRGVFTRMTITENLQMGAYIRSDKAGIAEDIEKMFVLFPRLRERKDQLAGTMSGGEQQMLAMGRALMSRPKVLLLDEPSMGLSPIMVDKIFEVVKDVSARGVTVLLVEQNASRALGIANRGYVMESGNVTMNGDAKELLNDPRVRAAYLGE
jgi:ABC-type branched-subunit amino acid transport system ATPase component